MIIKVLKIIGIGGISILFIAGGYTLGRGIENIYYEASFSLLCGICPLIFIESRKRKIGNRISEEGEELLEELLISYRINNNSITATIEDVIKNSNELKETKKLFFKLLIVVRDTGDKNKIYEATKEFSNKVGTWWAKMLGHSIYLSITENLNIKNSLEDILRNVRSAKLIREEEKRMNAETKRMLWLIPISWCSSYLMSVNACGISIEKLWENQFDTKEGTLCFMTLCVMTFACFFITGCMNKRKLDF